MLVGLPRVLSFYYLFPFYRTFLEELGIKYIETPPSTSSDLDRMVLCPTDEPCISVKIAFSHVKWLLDRGADVILVPSVVSLTPRSYCCPKMMGLPYMLQHGLSLKPEQLIVPLIDVRDHPLDWKNTWVRAAQAMKNASANGIMKNLKAEVFRALDKAWAALDVAGINYSRSLNRTRETQVDASRATEGKEGRGLTGIMGHAYILYDIFGKKIVDACRNYGGVVLAEMLDDDVGSSYLNEIPEGEKLWTIESRILGKSLYLLRERKVDRLILVSAFSCGPLSIVENYVAWEAQKNHIPFLNLTVDEHTGEAGLLTRIEAFMDACVYKHEQDEGKSDRPRSYYFSAPHGTESRVGMVNMGRLDIPLESLFRELGQDVVTPGPLSDNVAALGRELAPEFICYPMVVLLGQVRQIVEKGVNKILMVGGKGRCRLGWYAQVMEGILNRNGYDVKIVGVDSPFPWREKGETFKRACREFLGPSPVQKMLKGLSLALIKMVLLDKAEDMVREVRARERQRGQGDALYSTFLRSIQERDSIQGSYADFRRFCRDLADVEVTGEEPIHVMLVGEIYVVNEPFVNRDAERLLGSFEERVRVHRKLTVRNWMGYHLFKLPGSVREYRQVIEAASNYMPVSVGGHGQESLGDLVLAKRRGIDGVVHLFPFTCMPEIIAQNIMVRASRDLDLPVLSIMISEQTGVAGLATRLEAFCDLLWGRKKKRS